MHAALQRAVAPHGLRFGPDPSTHTRCTIGGMIGNNACGSRALGYGRTADNVAGLDVAFGTGEVLRGRRGERGDRGHRAGRRSSPTTSRTCARTSAGSRRQVSGYSLEHLLPEHGRRARPVPGRLARAPSGSSWRPPSQLVAEPRRTGCWWCSATRRWPRPPTPCRRCSAARATARRPARGWTPGSSTWCRRRGRRGARAARAAQGWLFVEVTGDDARRGLAAARAGGRAPPARSTHRVVDDAGEAAALWRIREDGAGLAARSLRPPGVLRLGGRRRPARAARRLAARLRRAAARARPATACPTATSATAACTCASTSPSTSAGRRAFRDFLVAAADGAARVRRLDLRRARRRPGPLGAAAADVRRASRCGCSARSRRSATPTGCSTPASSSTRRPLDADLRPARPRHEPPLALRFTHDGGSLGDAVHRCTGVGKCVADARPSGVMCPSYPATRDEKDSTRGRARVLQEALDGTLVRGLADPAVHEALDLCLACKGCARDCPTGVDMATYKAEVLHQTYAGDGAARAATTPWAGCRGGPGWPRRSRRAGQPADRLGPPWRGWPRPPPASTSGASLPRSAPPRTLRRHTPRRIRTTGSHDVPASRGPGRVALGRLVHRPLPARGRPRRRRGAARRPGCGSG